MPKFNVYFYSDSNISIYYLSNLNLILRQFEFKPEPKTRGKKVVRLEKKPVKFWIHDLDIEVVFHTKIMKGLTIFASTDCVGF